MHAWLFAFSEPGILRRAHRIRVSDYYYSASPFLFRIVRGSAHSTTVSKSERSHCKSSRKCQNEHKSGFTIWLRGIFGCCLLFSNFGLSLLLRDRIYAIKATLKRLGAIEKAVSYQFLVPSYWPLFSSSAMVSYFPAENVF